MDETTETLGGTPEQPAGAASQPGGIAWGDAISPERLEELQELFVRQQEWAAHLEPPASAPRRRQNWHALPRPAAPV